MMSQPVLRARSFELERTLARIGGHRHRRRCQRMLQLRIGEVDYAVEEREVGYDRQGEAGEHDRLAADLAIKVSEPWDQKTACTAPISSARYHTGGSTKGWAAS